jgi:hypothetical protein
MRDRTLLLVLCLLGLLAGGDALAQSKAPKNTTPPPPAPAPQYHQLGKPSTGTAPRSGAANPSSAADRTARARCMNLADAAARQRCVTGHATGGATVPATPQ